MSMYKEFQGKTLDEAIEEACAYFGVEREKLEVEIVNDAKVGIFGLVGVKKASIRAARIHMPDSVIADLSATEQAPVEGRKSSETRRTAADKKSESGKKGPREKQPEADKTDQAGAKGSRSSRTAKTAAETNIVAEENIQKADIQKADAQKENVSEDKRKEDVRRENKRVSGQRQAAHGREGQERTEKRAGTGKREKPKSKPEHIDDSPRLPDMQELEFDQDDTREEQLELALDKCSHEEICTVVRDVVEVLTVPIAGDVECDVVIVDDHVRVRLDCDENAGILVGREGQTLAAVQYLAVRIAARKLQGALRLQIEVGNYRERQDERLRELALSLAEKAKATKRSQATRPLSAYQRRVIHLALEADPLIHTHSKGEGRHRRVIVQVHRGRHGKLSSDDSIGTEPQTAESVKDEFSAQSPMMSTLTEQEHEIKEGPEA